MTAIDEQEHEHDFVTILVGSDLRQRCRLCTAIRLVPNPGDTDEELAYKATHGAHFMSEEEYVAVMGRALQRLYERETGLPAFLGSAEYYQWLKDKNLENKNGKI